MPITFLLHWVTNQLASIHQARGRSWRCTCAWKNTFNKTNIIMKCMMQYIYTHNKIVSDFSNLKVPCHICYKAVLVLVCQHGWVVSLSIPCFLQDLAIFRFHANLWNKAPYTHILFLKVVWMCFQCISYKYFLHFRKYQRLFKCAIWSIDKHKNATKHEVKPPVFFNFALSKDFIPVRRLLAISVIC